MAKRKTERKHQTRTEGKTAAKTTGDNTQGTMSQKTSMPVPAFAIKILSIVLAVILVISLTLYVLGRMPARGFWILAVILAIIAFGVMPWMRKKFAGR